MRSVAPPITEAQFIATEILKFLLRFYNNTGTNAIQ